MKICLFLKTIAIIAIGVGVFVGCKKSELTVPPSLSHFAGQSTAGYFIQNDPNSVYNVTVGVTTVSNVDRTINFTVTSPTGAAAGTQYNLATTSVTIPAGQTTANIPVKGLFAGYAGTRVDTLIFTLSGGGVEPAPFNNVFKLVLQKYCTVTLATLAGTYNNSFDLQTGSPDYGPYTTIFNTPVSTGATTGTMKIVNFWDVGTSITVNLDWTNPANFTTTIPQQFLYTDPTYGAATIKPVGTGKFSSCDKSFSFSYTVTVAAGSFGNFTTTIKL